MSETWKPKAWLAAVLAIFLQPFAFLYLNKPKTFFVYLFLLIAAYVVHWFTQLYPQLIIMFVCLVHAYVVAKKYDSRKIRKWYSRWWGLLFSYAALLAIIFLVRSFLFEPFSIPSKSMIPSFNVGDKIIVKKYGFGGYGSFGVQILNKGLSKNLELQRGKAYLFYPPHNDQAFIKRLIGKPGDSVEINADSISVNGSILSTTFLEDQPDIELYEEVSDGNAYQIIRGKSRRFEKEFNITVPENSYFFLGDNRDNSLDSRHWGSVSDSRFVGEVIYVIAK